MDAEARENLRQMPLEQLEVEQTRKLALKDSSVYLLGAGACMAAEGKRMCRKLREMLDREDSDAECMALDLRTKLEQHCRSGSADGSAGRRADRLCKVGGREHLRRVGDSAGSDRYGRVLPDL